jgi:nitrogenase-stabilizing/protective protein
LRKFGEEVAKIDELELTSQERVLDMYKFALVRVYKDFEGGYEPSAAEVWKMFDKPNPCMACSTLGDCSNKEMDNARENDSCSTEVPFEFYQG